MSTSVPTPEAVELVNRDLELSDSDDDDDDDDDEDSSSSSEEEGELVGEYSCWYCSTMSPPSISLLTI